MSYQENAFTCDSCSERADVKHEDYGPPAGWWMLAKLQEEWCHMDEDEYHFCSLKCANRDLGFIEKL